VKSNVIVSGFSRSHLINTARLLNEKNELLCLFSPFFPKRTFFDRFLIKRLREKVSQRRSLYRDIPIKTSFLPEILKELSNSARKAKLYKLADMLEVTSFVAFSMNCNRALKGFEMSHSINLIVRAGFGSCIERELDFVDASYVHPSCVESLLSGEKMRLSTGKKLSGIDRLIVEDCSRAKKIIANSTLVKESFVLAGFDEKKIEVLYLPPTHLFAIEGLNFIYTEKQIPKLIFVGNIQIRKGIAILFDIVEKFIGLGLQFELWLIGEWASDAEFYKQTLLETQNVKWFGWQSDEKLIEILKDGTLMVFPTLVEGGARVVTEAMALGLPVVTTENAGSPIVDRMDGIICKPNSEDFNQKILSLLANVELRKKISVNSRIRVRKEFSNEKYISTILDFIDLRYRGNL